MDVCIQLLIGVELAIGDDCRVIDYDKKRAVGVSSSAQ